MLLFVGLLAAIIAAGAIVNRSLVERYRWRWGQEPAPPLHVPSGPYRDGTTRPLRNRRVPLLVQMGAATSVAWGLVTLLVFVPSGMLLVLVSLRHDPLFASAVLAGCISGVGLAVGLMRAASLLVGRSAHVERRCVRLVGWSSLHHAVVFGMFGAFSVHEDFAGVALAMAAAPCALGLLHALLLHAAASAVSFDRAAG